MARCWLPVLTLLVLAIRGGAQQDKVRTVPFEGPEFFSHILHHERLRPIRSLQEAEADAANSLIILFGNPRLFQEDKLAGKRLQRFLDAGGNLVIATDYPLFINELTLGTTGSRVTQPDPKDAYRGDERCPWVSYADAGDHPLFQFLSKKLATNCPTWVSNYRVKGPAFTQRTVLVHFPRSAVADTPRLPDVTIKDPGKGKNKLPGPGTSLVGSSPPRPFLLPYMVGSPKNAPPDGRVLLIAGHGMFMNGMMVQKDNDNFDFAGNLVRWLRESSSGEKRTRALFMVDSEVVTNFDMKLTGMPPIPVPTVEHLNRLLRGLEEERFFQKLLADLFGVYLGRFIAILVAIATFVLLIYGAKKFLEGRVHLETGVPSMVGLLPAQNSARPMEERSRARLRLNGDFSAECRQLALDWLRAEFDVTPDRWRAEVQAELVVDGSFWSRSKLRRQADLVLVLARAAGNASRHDFFRLVEALRNLTAALREGRVVLLVAGQKVVRNP